MPLDTDRGRAALARLAALGVRDADVRETFIHAGGKGGQNVNKVATCVVLVHVPTGTSVKCQQERTQGQNRVVAREWLADKLEAARAARARAAADERERERRRKRPRSRRSKARMLAGKRANAAKKATRGPVARDD